MMVKQGTNASSKICSVGFWHGDQLSNLKDLLESFIPALYVYGNNVGTIVM